MSKHVLLISQCFAPQNKIGAVRPTKLAKYLQKMGYQVTVLCGKDYTSITDPLLNRDLEQIPDVLCIEEKSLLRWWKQRKQPIAENIKPSESKSNAGKSRSWRNAVYLFLTDRSDMAFARACKRTIRKMGKHYDVVISTYGPLSVHRIADYAKQNGYAERWIADFRDETSVPFKWQNSRLKRYNKMVMHHADQITSISTGCLRVMGMENMGHVVHNGYDPEDMRNFAFPPKRTDKLAFIHCGQMYGAQRDLSPIFQTLSALIMEGKIEKNSVALVYAGRDTDGFVAQAMDAGLSDCLEGHGFMPRDKSLKLQKESHVLLLPAWNMKERQGNIPGKLLEYMMLEMPVICYVSGEEPDSEVAGIIRDTNIGICCEQVNQQADIRRLRMYLESIIEAFLSGNPIPFTPDREAVANFTSEGMAHKMANIIEECME